MNFNLAETRVSTPRLKPYGIYTVTFKGIEEKSGKSSNDREWHAFQLNFEGVDGIFAPMFFCPQDNGDKRMTGETNGRKWELPAPIETLVQQVGHICSTMAPEKFEKVKSKLSFELPKDFSKLIATLQKILADAVGKEFDIKLVADSRGYATIPSNTVRINRDGYAYVSNRWIGSNLSFTPYEIGEKTKFENAKPSSPEVIGEETSSHDDDDDLDLDDL